MVTSYSPIRTFRMSRILDTKGMLKKLLFNGNFLKCGKSNKYNILEMETSVSIIGSYWTISGQDKIQDATVLNNPYTFVQI